jgi:hypothetical protein
MDIGRIDSILGVYPIPGINFSSPSTSSNTALNCSWKVTCNLAKSSPKCQLAEQLYSNSELRILGRLAVFYSKLQIST